MLEFKTEAHRTTYELVASHLRELFGESARSSEKRPTFYVRFGSAVVQVSVTAWGDDDAVVRAIAVVTRGTEITFDVLHYLMRCNYAMRFGAFTLAEDGDICFEYAVVGSTIDKEELRAGVNAVAVTADDEDDKIIAQFGGNRGSD
ncbi:MAG: YbjN domain-containing protein [Coriobacteriia bacterium]|nr:YbjN domain-containing protein [Coriobacteriia bacterium]